MKARGVILDSIIGKYVWSTSGRDKGNLFIVTAVVDDQYVMLADGKLRKLEKPKKKKLKHLVVTEFQVFSLHEQVKNHRKIQDSDLRDAIQHMKDQLNGTVIGGD